MPITAQEALQRTIEHREIFPDEMLSIMRRIMSGELTPVMIAALTVGLRVKKETIGEIAAAAQVMRDFATRVEVPDRENLVDIVGTGGDSSQTFNISTASMFVAAAAISPIVSFLTRRPTVSAAIITGVNSPLMIRRMIDSISSGKISRCSIVRCSASWAVMGMSAPVLVRQGCRISIRARAARRTRVPGSAVGAIDALIVCLPGSS